MPKDRISQYIAEEAERWIAVDERIRGLTIALMAVTDAAIECDPSLRPRIIARLQEVLSLYVSDQKHPDRIREIREFLIGLEGDDPTAASAPPRLAGEPT